MVDGAEGGTGASPELLLNHTGIPMTAIPAAREALDECGMSGKVALVAAGVSAQGLMPPNAALGADAGMIATCLYGARLHCPDMKRTINALAPPGACHHCHTGLCPVGVATQILIWKRAWM